MTVGYLERAIFSALYLKATLFPALCLHNFALVSSSGLDDWTLLTIYQHKLSTKT
ncbi:hypothetical protein K505DRAFT_321744 [Melanomma pulvis-pyrius CBS 109.77]|uniref:Uncharacterized protein n=1 Tax=Melanomma pulvis-pyrius CBS 109.77 TaxID=1314802 RepID=A0A6A6XSQ0_9PLEO|nr:hypothetical protein K505DRAFT_321744 [Melanomma pulvis-pyrius CBS 109.77]